VGSQDEIDFAPAVMALGTAAFATRLLAALNRGIAIDHLAIMRFEDRIRPPVIESAVWLGGEHVATVQRAYLERFYRLDPVLRYAGVDHRVLHLRRDELMDGEYRRTAYVRAGLLERLTVAAPDGSRLIVLNLYRREQGGPFASHDVQRVEAHAPLLAALTLKHVGMIGALLRSRDRGDRLAALAARLQALEPRLTRRELDVLARALAGLTSAGIALDLRISLNTVLTYRKRAYGRLGVSSQAELFSRCLA
jgi:DNA-binding CsgD family transcriptional regulator